MPITGRPRDLYDEWLEQNRQYESQYIANQAEDIYAGWRPQAGYPVTYWENPQRVARYHDLRQAMGPEWQPPDWLDAGLNDAAYEYYKHVNGGNPNPNTWLNLDQNDPMREVLRSMPPPPDYALWPDEQQYAQQGQYAPGELLNPEQGGMTQAQWDALAPWQRTMYGMANNPEVMGTVTGAAAGGIGMGDPLSGAAVGGLLGNLFGSLSMTPVKDADGNTVKDPVTGLPVYQENKKLSWLMKLMNGLDYGAELIERSMGTAYQLTGSVFNPEEYGSLSEVLGNLPAAWRAAHLTDESGGFLNYIDLYMQAYGSNLSSEEIRRRASFMPDVSDPLNYVEAISAAIEGREANIANIGETWTWDSPVPVRPEGGMGLQAIVDARRRLAAGEAPTDVWNSVTAQHGMTGFTTDLIGHIVLDPLNIAGPLAVGTILDPLAKATNNVPLLKAITETGGEGPIKVLQTYGQNVRNLPVEDIPHNWITRRLAGLDADYNWKTLQQTQTKVPTWKKGLAVGQKAFTGVLLGNLVGGPVGAAVGGMTGAIIGIGSDMTPVAKAMEVLNSAGLTLHTVLSRAGADPDLMVKYVRSLSNTPVDLASEIGMQSIKSPETASLPMFLKDALKGADELLVKYKANQQNAKLLDQLEAATGMPANKILQQIQNNPKQADVLLRQMVEKARASADPAAKKLVEAYDDAQATMHKLPPEAHPTGQKLVDAVKTFTGDNPAPRNAEQFRAQLFAQLMDAGDKWAVDWFGVKPDPKWARLGALVKSAQNLALLGLNPTYLVNNALNNVVTMAAEGVLGLKTPEQIVKFWDEFGVMSPRLKAGYGPAASGTETSHLALRSAMDAKDTLQAATDFLNRTSDKVGIFGRLSQKFEQLSSAEAVTTGTQQAWNRLHRRGTGFALMDGGLEAELRNAGVRPEDVYALIEGAMNQKDLEARLWQGTGTNRLDRAVPAIVEQYAKRGVKLDPGEVKTLLQEAGVYKDLSDTLAGAETIEDVHRAFRATEGKIQNHIRKLTQDAYMARVMADASVVKTEGQPGTLRMWDDLNMAEAEAFNGHWQRSAELQQKLMENPDQEASLWDEFFKNERAEYDTFYKEQEGKVLAILYGTGIQNPEARSIADGYVKRADNWRDFYKARDEMYKNIRAEKFDTREARNAAWNKLHDDMEKLYQEAYGRDLEYQIETDGKFIDKVKIIFPERVPAIEAWRSDMVTFRREVYGRMARFRQMLRTMPAEERGAAWTKFLNEEYMPLYRDYLQKQVDGAHAIAGKMSGEAPEVPGGKVPEPPVKPSGTPSEQVVELARQAGIATATKDGKPMDKAVVNTVNKYTGKKYTKIEDTPEFLQDFKDALRRKKVVDVKTKVVDNAADLSNIPREDLLLVLRETIDEARVEHEGRVTAEAKADTDTLTGYKTYTMSGPDDTGPNSQFNPEVDKAKAVAVLDFEGLAYTNNTYGHPMGNALIREFVRAANEIAAEFGVELYRGSKGGDEFIIPGKNITTVKKVAQRIRDAFAKGRLVVKEKDGSTYSVTGFGLHVGTGRNFADADAAAKLDVTPGYVRNERPPSWQYTRIDEPRGADAVVRDAEPPEIRAGEEAAGRAGEAGTAETEPLTPETIKQLDNEAAVMEAEDAIIAQVQQVEALEARANEAVAMLEPDALPMEDVQAVKTRLRSEAVENAGYTPEQADALVRVHEALAQTWARENNRSVAEYWNMIGGVRKGGLPEGERLYQVAPPKDSPELRTWNAGNKIVDENGTPLTLYHGTLSNFQEFRAGSPEAHWGDAFYFTNTMEDASLYASKSGPDWKNKIESQLDQLENVDDWYPFVDQLVKITKKKASTIEKWADDGTVLEKLNDKQKVALASEMIGLENEGVVMPVYVKMERPLDTTDAGTDRLSYEFEENADGDIISESGTAIDFLNAIDDAGARLGLDVEEVKGDLLDHFGEMDGVLVKDAIHYLRENSNVQELEGEWGNDYKLLSSQFLQEIVTNMGYDGIIQDAWASFGTKQTRWGRIEAMEGINTDTRHYIIFNNRKVKSVFNRGTFDPTDPNILRQGERAAVSFEDGVAIMHALEKPDVTSLFHETGHIFRRLLNGDDLAVAEEYAGVRDGQWTVDAEEKFANAFVRYMADGEAPRPALVKVFESFKRWVLNIYTTLTGTDLDVEVSPKLRDLFDKWLGKEMSNPVEETRVEMEAPTVDAEPARIEDVPGVEVVRAEVEAPKPKQAKAPKAEKPGKFGYTQAEVEQIAPKLKEWVDANVPETAREAVAGWINKKETVEVAAKPLHITIPGSELTIKNVSAGIYLYKLLTGKPMPGFEQAKITTPLLTSGRIGVGVGAFVPKGGELSRDVYAAIRLYGSPQEAANTIRAQMGTNPEGVGWDTLRMSNVLMELERLASHPEKQQAKYIADAQAAQSWELQPTRFMKPSKGKYLFQPSRWFQTDGGVRRVLYPQTQARTDTPEFRAWFGESKVVDEQGQPLVVYHSTDAADITRFRSKGYSGLNTDGNASDPAMAQTSRLGHWFSHRDITPETQQNIVYPVYLTIEHPYKTNLDSLVDEIKDIGSGTALKRKLMAEGYDGIILEDTEFGGMSYVAFRPEQIKSTFNRGTYSKSNKNILYQSGDGRVHQVKNDGDAPEAIGHMGAADSLTSTNPPIADMAREGWEKNIRPLMKELERYLTSPDGMAPDTLKGRASALDPQTARKLRVYMEQVKGQMADTKLQSVKYGEMKRDRSLLNYSRRYGFDNVLQMAMPYQFWYTRSALNWAMRAIDNPGYLAAWAKIRQAQERAVNSPGFPKRLQNKMRIPIPFLPEWMGGGLYVDPLRQLFPFENFLRPFEQMERDQNLIDRRAQFILLGWAEDGTEEEAEVQQALAAMSGPTWERAYAQAQMEVETDTSNPWDFASLMMGYSLPIEWMRRYATGKQDQIGQLPITRLVQSATSAVGLNKGRGYNLEGPLRRALGLPEYGAYTDYYLDRMLASMAADGTITTDEALRAMVDRSGPAFEEAQARVSDTNSLKLAAGGFAPDIFPEGEQIGRAEYTEYQKAIEAWQAGDETAMTTFYDKFPEYEARKAINQEPDVRLHKYLIGAVWDAYRALPELHQRQAAEALGEQFEQQFLNKETRSYDGITSETLAYWAQALGGHAPDSMGEQPAADLGLADEATTAAYQGYIDAKKQMFPNLSAVQNVYFKIPEGPARDAYAAKHPELDEYNVWRNAYLADNPEIIQYVIGEENKVYGASPEEQALYYQFNATRDYRYPGIFQLQDQYYALPSNQRRGFLQQYPQLAEYWDWRREWLKQYPNMIPYIMSTESLYQAVFNETMPAISNTGAYPVGGPTPQVNIMDGFSQPLMRQLTGWAYAGQSLGTGAQRELMTHWREQGQPGTFDEWMERVRAQVRDQ